MKRTTKYVLYAAVITLLTSALAIANVQGLLGLHLSITTLICTPGYDMTYAAYGDAYGNSDIPVQLFIAITLIFNTACCIVLSISMAYASPPLDQMHRKRIKHYGRIAAWITGEFFEEPHILAQFLQVVESHDRTTWIFPNHFLITWFFPPSVRNDRAGLTLAAINCV